jgi:hypothetical protein
MLFRHAAAALMPLLSFPFVLSSAAFAVEISAVHLSAGSFAPATGQTVALRYTLDVQAQVSVKVYDPDFSLVRNLLLDASRGVGSHEEVWDGLDFDEVVVPDEAYFFTITARDEKEEAVYDPTTFSGGDQFDITKADISAQRGTITYQLDDPSRVLIRIGIAGGPLLHSPVTWKPRIAGEITDYWNGRDQDDLIDLRNHPRFRMVITGFKLVENSVITYGNTREDYVAYKSRLGDRRLRKPPRTSVPRTEVRISPHYRRPRVQDKPLDVSLTLPDTKQDDDGAISVSAEKQLVRVELAEDDLAFLADEPFEVSFFLNGEYYAEEEVGYVPYNWVWNVSEVTEGQHILTVNLSSFKDIIGIRSRKIRLP